METVKKARNQENFHLMRAQFAKTKVWYWQATNISRYGSLQTEYSITKQLCTFDFEST